MIPQKVDHGKDSIFLPYTVFEYESDSLDGRLQELERKVPGMGLSLLPDVSYKDNGLTRRIIGSPHYFETEEFGLVLSKVKEVERFFAKRKATIWLRGDYIRNGSVITKKQELDDDMVRLYPLDFEMNPLFDKEGRIYVFLDLKTTDYFTARQLLFED